MCIAEELFNTDTGERVSSPRHPRHRGKIREREGGQVQTSLWCGSGNLERERLKQPDLEGGGSSKHRGGDAT